MSLRKRQCLKTEGFASETRARALLSFLLLSERLQLSGDSKGLSEPLACATHEMTKIFYA